MTIMLASVSVELGNKKEKGKKKGGGKMKEKKKGPVGTC